MSTKKRVYLVLSKSWSYDDEWWYGDNKPVKAFTDRARAEEYLARCEQQERAWQQENWGAQTETKFEIVETEIAVGG